MVLNILQCTEQPPPLPPAGNYQAPNVNSSEVEQPWSRGLKIELYCHSSGTLLNINFCSTLVLIMSSWHYLGQPSHKPLLDTLYYGEKTGLRHWFAQGHAGEPAKACSLDSASKLEIKVPTYYWLLQIDAVILLKYFLFHLSYGCFMLSFRWLEEILQKSFFSYFVCGLNLVAVLMLCCLLFWMYPLNLRIVFLLRYSLYCEFFFLYSFWLLGDTFETPGSSP